MSRGLAELVRFQELTLGVQALIEKLEQMPSRLAQLEAETEERRVRLAEAKQVLEKETKKRRDLERSLSDTETKISRYKDQLMSVKTNDEYRAMNQEIAHEQERVEALEEQILVLMESSDELVQRVKKSEKDVAKGERALEQGRAAVEQEGRELEAERTKLEHEAGEVKKRLDPDLLALYRRVAEQRGGVAMAVVEDDTCSACRVRVRPQVQAELRNTDNIFQCESCQRILYWVP
jgi:predicted  nucleic acid-binding Zn-ribbon protein